VTVYRRVVVNGSTKPDDLLGQLNTYFSGRVTDSTTVSSGSGSSQDLNSYPDSYTTAAKVERHL
jgi:hypothetical protein